MTETVTQFGPGGELLGIVTVPGGKARGGIACLLINAGIIHRVGPHRMNVKLARALAEIGVLSMRMDLSGLGDSAAARTGRDFWDQAVIDMQAGMDYLERAHGVTKFIVLGICSGAVNGYFLTKQDPRIVGLLMFDGFAYPTWKTAVIRRWTRLRRLPFATVMVSALAAGRGYASRAFAPDPRLSDDGAVQKYPTKDEFGTAMEELVARGVDVFLAYSHTLEHHNYDRQLGDSFPGHAFVSRIRYAYLPDVDHALTAATAQRQFIDHVTGWVNEVVGRR